MGNGRWLWNHKWGRAPWQSSVCISTAESLVKCSCPQRSIPVDLCRIIATRDYSLLLGLPGTGKTSTIVVAVMALLSLGRSVLLTSYTNSAVDNIMLKLAAMGVRMLRLGRSEGVHPGIWPYTIGGSCFPDTSAPDMKRIARDIKLVSLLHQCVTDARCGLMLG